MMTRKDYVEVANILKAYVGKIDEDFLAELVSDFEDMFSKDNERFDFDRFYTAVYK
jgi:hypothetical protein